MPQTVVDYNAHVIGRDELMAVQPSPHARTAVERQAAARTGTDLYPIAERLAVAVREARGIDHVNHVLLRQFGHEDTVDLRAPRKRLAGVPGGGSAACVIGFCAFSARLSLMISPSVASSG